MKEQEKKERKRILLVCPATLFPTTMMTQVRAINLVKGLAREHEVDVAVFCHSRKEEESCREGLKDMCRAFYPLMPVNHRSNRLGRKYYGIKQKVLYYLLGRSRRYTYYANGKTNRQTAELIARNGYDIVHVEYWFLGKVFELLPSGIFKAIDSIAMMEELQESYANKRENKKLSFWEGRELRGSARLQHHCFEMADLVTCVSRQGEDILKKVSPGVASMTVPIGQELGSFTGYPAAPDRGTLIFYGTMGSQQNQHAFWRLWNRVLPLIKERIPGVKLLVVGANPPENIRRLDDGETVRVTGFVDDPREYLAKANVLVLPLETGGGFRGRIVEVMAMGLPVVGTHNALDSVHMTHGEHGFITDDDKEMADTAVRLMQDDELRNRVSSRALDFVKENYSLEETVGKLSKFYAAIEK